MLRLFLSTVIAAGGFLVPRKAAGSAPPSISTQPESQSVVAGSNAGFTVVAGGQGTLHYQWALNGTNLTDSAHFRGATNATLTISDVLANDAGAYQVVVSNSHGNVTSSNAVLTVLFPAAITGQPTNRSVLLSNNVVFAAAADGTVPLSYQWYFKGAPLTDNGHVSGSLTTELTIASVQTNDAGSYQLVVTNNYGSATSTVATLTVLVPPFITTQPSSQTVQTGDTASFVAGITGTSPLSCQWFLNGTPLTDNSHSSGTSTTNLTINNVQAADVGNYTLVVTNDIGAVTSIVASLHVNLSLADEFNPNANAAVNALAETGDGRILVGGQFTNLAGQACSRVARLLPDGGRDSSYNPSADNTVYTFAVQSNLQVIAGGDFIYFSGQQPRRLARLNSDGGADGGFNPWPDNTVRCTVVQPDGLILAGGGFSLISLTTQPFLARLEPGSVLDSSFTPVLDGAVNAIALQPDGKILIGGTFTQINGEAHQGIARLNPDGSVDTGFAGSISASGWGCSVNAILLQPDGRILIGGVFGGADGQPRANLARLNPDGTLDTSFQADTSGAYPAAVDSFSLQADGKIYVGGSFNAIAGQPRHGVACLNPDGSLDPDFYPDENPATVYAQALQADGKLVLGGLFSSMGQQARNNIARLNPIEPATQDLTFDITSVTWQRGGSATEVWRTTFDSTTNGVDWRRLGDGTRVPGGWQLNGLNLPTNAIVRARGSVCGGNWFVESLAGPPMIVSQSPGPNLTLYAGNSGVYFTVSGAGGTPLSYQWLKNGAPLSDTGNISGSRTSSLFVANIYGADAGQYQVVLSNAWGSITGAVMTLNVVDPVIWSQSGSLSVNPGQTASFTVNATGSSPLQYQWRWNGIPLPAGTNATLTISNAQAADAGAYTVVVNNQWGSLTGAVCTLTVNIAFPDAFSPVSGGVTQWALQPDGKVIAAGYTSQAGLVNDPKYLTRFNPDGSSDAGFNFTNVVVDIRALALQTDKQILIAGNTRQTASIWRFNSDGSPDPTFNSAIFGTMDGLVLPADGGMFVGGTFSYSSPPVLTNLALLQPDGSVNTNFLAGINGTVYALAQQPDGKLLVSGSFTQVNGQPATNLVRLTANGVIDTGFTASVVKAIYCLLPQPDGKILVGGSFTTLDGANINNLGRINADGSLDTNFNPNVNGTVESLALQADGKIVLGGEFTSVSGLSRDRLARLNPDGSPDLLFNPNVNGPVYAVGLQPDGALLVGGTFSQINGQGRTNFSRLIATDPAIQTLSYNGSTITWLRGGTAPEVWRTTFESSTNGSDWTPLGAGVRVPGGWQLNGVSLPPNANVRARGFVQSGRNDAASWFVESSLGPALVLGQPEGQTNLAGTTARFWVTGGGTPPLSYQWLKDGRPLTNGDDILGADTASLELSDVLGGNDGYYSVIVSNASGSVTSSVANLTVVEPVITVQPVAIYTNAGQTAQFSVAAIGTPPLTYQWLKNGTIMGTPNLATLTLPNVQSNDIASYSVIVSSTYGAVTSSAVALTLNLVLPDSLNAGLNDEVRSLATQPDGKIYIGGNFDKLGDQWFYGFGRLNPDGTRDTNFTGNVDSSADTVAVLPDGNVLVGGWFNYANNWPHSLVCRFYPDGSLDPAINPTITSSTVSPSIESLVPQPDGKFLIGGFFNSLAGQMHNYVGRFNADGSVDSFSSTGANDYVQVVALQADGKVIVAGRFTALEGQTRNHIARLNADGTLDSSFNPNANNIVNSVVIQPDGKILAGGSFTSIAGASRTCLARLNPDGSIDPTFNVNLTGGVSSIALQADGSMILAGVTSVDGQARYGLARVSASGVLDPNWSPQIVGGVGGVSIQADGKVLICGSFSSVCGQPRSNLARLDSSGPANHRLVCDPAGVTWWRSGASPEVSGVQFQLSPDGTNWTRLGPGVRVDGGWRLDTTALSVGEFVRAYGFASGGRWNGSLSLIADTTVVSAQTQPLIISNVGSFGMQPAGFGFNWQGLTNQSVIVEASTNLVDWLPLQTNLANGASTYFLDSAATNFPRRFYRLRLQ